MFSLSQKLINDIYAQDHGLSRGGMTYYQHVFLAELIEKYRPKKILEVGVQAGATTSVLLKLLEHENYAETTLCSQDFFDVWQGPNKELFKITSIFDETKPPLDKWKLYTKGYVGRFYNELPHDFDMCILDTSHTFPGEILDYLMILPMLNKNAIMVIHDLMIQWSGSEYDPVTCVLFSAIEGEKILPTTKFLLGTKPNIGAVRLSDAPFENILSVFNLLTLQWKREFPKQNLSQIHSFLSQFYNDECLRLYEIGAYLNTGEDISRLDIPACSICLSNAASGPSKLNDNGACAKCNSSHGQRVLHSFMTELAGCGTFSDVLIDRALTTIPKISLNNHAVFQDFTPGTSCDKFNLVALAQDASNEQALQNLLTDITNIMAETGSIFIACNNDTSVQQFKNKLSAIMPDISFLIYNELDYVNEQASPILLATCNKENASALSELLNTRIC